MIEKTEIWITWMELRVCELRSLGGMKKMIECLLSDGLLSGFCKSVLWTLSLTLSLALSLTLSLRRGRSFMGIGDECKQILI